MKRVVLLLILPGVLLLAACDSGEQTTTQAPTLIPPSPTTPAPVDTEPPTDPTPTPEAIVTEDAEPAADPNSFTFSISGPVEAALTHVDFLLEDELYTIRFYIPEDVTDAPVSGDVLITLPADVRRGVYTVGPATSTVIEFNEILSDDALVTVTLGQPDGSPFAVDSPVYGFFTISDKTDDALTGEFSLTIGDETGDIRLVGAMFAISGDIAP